MRADPVLILMQPRSGSSMTAEIFHRHGLWVGRLPPPNGAYQTWENEDLRMPLKRLCKAQNTDTLGLRELRNDRSTDNVRGLFENVVPPATDWMYKVPIDRWPVIRPAFPDARYVFVRRPTESVIASLVEKVPSKSETALREHVFARHAYLDGLAMEYGIPVVQTQEVIDGNLATLETAMRRCGMELDPSIVTQVVDRTQWRH